MQLQLMYDQLLTRAQKTGRDQHADLKGGARLAVRVREGIITVSFCRPNKLLGATEEATFRAVCQVPGDAVRIPEMGQKERRDGAAVWHIVAYRWSEPTVQAPASVVPAPEPAAAPAERTMPALSLTQPWASLVGWELKGVETRDWRTKYTGPIAIHAAKGFPDAAQDLCQVEPFASAIGGRELPLGAVVAVCDLVACFRITEARTYRLPNGETIVISDQEFAFGDYTPGRFGWVLRTVRVLSTPIPARGMPGLWPWTVPDEVAGLVFGGSLCRS